MKKLIHRDYLLETIKQEGYKYFCDEFCRLVSIDNLTSLLYYKYLNSVADIWNFSIDDDKLVCKNISGMVMMFPLSKNMNELEQLKDWKEQQLQVESQWNPQKIGKLLNIRLGESITKNIQPKIERLLLEKEMLYNTLRTIRFCVYHDPNSQDIWNLSDQAIKFVENDET